MGNDIDRSFGVLTYMNGLMCWSFVFRLVFYFLYKFCYGTLGMFGVMAGGAGSW